MDPLCLNRSPDPETAAEAEPSYTKVRCVG